MTIRKEILDELLRDYKNPEDLLGENVCGNRLIMDCTSSNIFALSVRFRQIGVF
jgi:hypothetical protein